VVGHFRVRIILVNTGLRDKDMMLPWSEGFVSKKDAKKDAARVRLQYLFEKQLYPHDPSLEKQLYLHDPSRLPLAVASIPTTGGGGGSASATGPGCCDGDPVLAITSRTRGAGSGSRGSSSGLEQVVLVAELEVKVADVQPTQGFVCLDTFDTPKGKRNVFDVMLEMTLERKPPEWPPMRIARQPHTDTKEGGALYCIENRTIIRIGNKSLLDLFPDPNNHYWIF
jgi:hypothetical protein